MDKADFQKRISGIFSEACEEELKKLQNEFKDLEEHCKSFSANVEKKCKDKFDAIKKELANESKEEFMNYIIQQLCI